MEVGLRTAYRHETLTLNYKTKKHGNDEKSNVEAHQG